MIYTRKTIRARQAALVLAILLTLTSLVAPAPTGFDGRTMLVALLAGYLIATTHTGGTR